MAIQAVATKVREAFTGSKYAFDFDFEVYDETELLVYAIDTTTSPETKTLLTLGVDYSVTLNEVTPGGTVTYTDARSSDYDSFIESDVPYEQETAFPNAEAVELMGDKLCRQIQQLKDAADRTIKLDSATAVTSITVADPEDRRALVAEVTGGVVTIVPSDYDPDELGTSAAEAAASAAAAADSEAAAAGYAASVNLPSPLVTTGAVAIVKSDLTGYEFGPAKSTDGTFASNSDSKFPTEKATKTYVDGAGRVLQTVVAITQGADSTITAIPDDDTTPQITEGKEALSLSITPKSATSILIIEASANLSSTDNGVVIIALFKGTGADALATAFDCVTDEEGVGHPSLTYYLVSGGVSTLTFSLRFGSAGTTTYINRREAGTAYNATLVSSLKITEVAQ